MKSFYFLISAILCYAQISAQVFTDSNLPIVIINTDIDTITGDPLGIRDDPKVLASMKIIYHPDGTRNYITDQDTEDYLNYSGRIGIELRGSSSQGLLKKPYGLTTLEADNVANNNVSILGMPSENDWILNSLAYDKSLIRDYLSYELAREIGDYAARGKYCEVVVNGDYKGLYVFMEKLKIDSDRIDIVKIKDSENDLPELSGGFITKCDKTTGDDPIAWSFRTNISDLVDFIHERPKPEAITPQQDSYIQTVFDNLANAANAQNAAITDGYPSIIDIPSFVDFMLLNEIASNVDAYQFSTYFHKDRSGKLRAGPIWDFNLTFGNDLFMYFLDRSHTNVWQFNNGDNVGAPFWKDLFDNSVFNCYLSKRWSDLTAANQTFNYIKIENKIDTLVDLLSEARIRENERWNTIAQYDTEISELKSWLQERITWIDANIGGSTNCSFPEVPDIVISEINYNPADSVNFESDDLEFIALSNNGTSDISLTGFYFRALGISYQFPEGSILMANSKIFLASNSNAFTTFHGIAPFGVFTRNLSNKTQQLLLTDAFGNTIDDIVYADKSPWPADADGTGAFLLLTDLNSDNSDPGNWIASNQNLGIADTINAPTKTSVYPNPANSIIFVENQSFEIKKIEIYDLMGRRMLHSNTNSNSVGVNIDKLSNASYILKVTFKNDSSIFRNILKSKT